MVNRITVPNLSIEHRVPILTSGQCLAQSIRKKQFSRWDWPLNPVFDLMKAYPGDLPIALEMGLVQRIHVNKPHVPPPTPSFRPPWELPLMEVWAEEVPKAAANTRTIAELDLRIVCQYRS